ncbi:MAG: zinc ribbon domain-containing protein [Gemmatimonadota bacterium]
MEGKVPIFEYRCAECSRVFERLVRSAAEGVACPDCASRRVEKLLSAASTPRSRAGAPTPFGNGGDGCCAGGGCGCSN